MTRIFVRLAGWYAALALFSGIGFVTFSLLGIGVLGIGAIVIVEGALSYYASQIAIRCLAARPCSNALSLVLNPTAARFGIPALQFYVFPSASVSALVLGFGKNQVFLCSSYIVEQYPPDEVVAILAHEAAHVRHRDLYLYTALAMAMTVLTPVPGMILASWLAARIALAILIPPLVMLIPLLAVSRWREYLADEFGCRISENPQAFVSALKRSESAINSRAATREIQSSAWTTLFAPHPTFADRIRNASTGT